MSTPVVLITGAAGGLGRAIAKRFAQSHWRIAATDVDKEGLHALNAQVPLDASGVADLRSADNCHTLMSKILARTGRLDALVNAYHAERAITAVELAAWPAVVDGTQVFVWLED